MRIGFWLAAAIAVAGWATTASAGPRLKVTLDAGAEATSGRLLVFARALPTSGKPPARVDSDEVSDDAPSAEAAMEVDHIAPGGSVEVDLDQISYPQPFSRLPPGDYAVQAVLDVNHDYNYGGRGAGDVLSPVATLRLPFAEGAGLRLGEVLTARDPWAPAGATPARLAELAQARPHMTPLAFTSPALSAFWGRPTVMRGWVLTPPGYQAGGRTTYPTVYFTHGFGSNTTRLVVTGAQLYQQMVSGAAPAMIWVLLDESSPTGTHEFADSVNNGPWGQALTTELIPRLERDYRMDGRPSGRFLTGHSSGGWATLWLQTRYPKLFGGTWSTAPDPSDFHDFTNIDLYAPGANAYRRADGAPTPLMRQGDKTVLTFQQYTTQEDVQGRYGGQIRSFDWVFSPRGPDGQPMALFNRTTGAVDPVVAAYWRDHYDIAARLQRDWPKLKPDLDGKIHVAVGTADTFYLDGPAHRLQAVLDGLGAKSRFEFIEGRTHFDLLKIGDNTMGLLNRFAGEMYAVARPPN